MISRYTVLLLRPPCLIPLIPRGCFLDLDFSKVKEVVVLNMNFSSFTIDGMSKSRIISQAFTFYLNFVSLIGFDLKNISNIL